MMPRGVWFGQGADLIQANDFFGAEAPLSRREIVTKLLFVAGSEDHGIDTGLADHPVQRDLGRRRVAVPSDVGEDVDDAIHALQIYGSWRIELVKARFRRAPVASEFASRATAIFP